MLLLARWYLCIPTDELRDFIADIDLIPLLEFKLNAPIEEIAMVAACKEKASRFSYTEWYLAFCVKVCDEAQVICIQDVQRLIWSIDCQVFTVDISKEATCCLELMVGVNFLKISCSVKLFRNLSESRRVHSSLVMHPELSHSFFHVLLDCFLSAMQLSLVFFNFVLLFDHHSLQLAYLTLENLHFFR